MSEAELKLTLFRWIDQLSGDRLKWLYKLIEKQSGQSIVTEKLHKDTELNAGYAAMAADHHREREAEEWIEHILHQSEI